MFKLNPNPTFTAPVPLSVPGMASQIELKVTFRHKTKDGLAKWLEQAGTSSDEDMLAEVITDWQGLVDEAGEPAPYNRTNLQTLLDNYATARGEFFAVYMSELGKSKRKNF